MTLAEANEVLRRAGAAGHFDEELLDWVRVRFTSLDEAGLVDELWAKLQKRLAEKASTLLCASIDAAEVSVERDFGRGWRVVLLGAWGFEP